MYKQENGFTKLNSKEKQRIQELAKTDKDVARLLEIYDVFLSDPNKEWYYTIIKIQKMISDSVDDGTLDVEKKGNLKNCWEVLKGGAAASKTILAAKADAGMNEDVAAEKKEPGHNIKPITAETAKANV